MKHMDRQKIGMLSEQDNRMLKEKDLSKTLLSLLISLCKRVSLNKRTRSKINSGLGKLKKMEILHLGLNLDLMNL